jgi:hypothetical protein
VPRYAIELSLEDRPGALGEVASRIGELGGDVVDVDVLEHGHGGRARDEITVDLAGPEAAELLAAALSELPGVEVEHVGLVGEYGHHLLVDALEVAAAIVAEPDPAGVLDALVSGCVAAFDVSWAVVVSEGRERPLAVAGGVPPASVVRAGGGPLRLSEGEDRLALPIGDLELALVVGREGWPWRNRERRELTSLTHICASRLEQLGGA